MNQPSFPTGSEERARLIGNALAACATWKGEEMIGRKGKPMLLRVQMKQAKLYGFDFD